MVFSKISRSLDTHHYSQLQAGKPFETGPVKTEDAKTAYQMVLANGGAILPKRDAADTRIVNNVKTRTGSIIKSQNDVGGWPKLTSAKAPIDSDKDGMPDSWEKKNSLNPNDAGDGNKVDKDGYTMLEKYLNSIQ